jgi:hypothetical protein
MSYRLMTLAIVAAMCVASISAGPASAAIYNVNDHWTASEDWTGDGIVAMDADSYGTPNVWRYESAAAGDFDPANRSLLTEFGTRWSYGDGNSTGYWCYVEGGRLHPDDGPLRDPIRTWVSPVTGMVRIEGSISAPASNDGVIAYIHHGSTELFSAVVFGDESATTENFFLEDVAVSIGDTISFRVNIYDDYNHGDGAEYDPTITLTAVPEPATMSLLALGALALLKRRKS